MSHVTTIDLEIKDLGALERAARRCGMELRRGQTTYRWFEETEADDDSDARKQGHAVPEGFKLGDLGRCDHALSLAAEGDGDAYEIGVAMRRDGGEGYVLLADLFDSTLRAAVGTDCNQLRQAYAIETAIGQAQAEGFGVEETVLANGSVELTLTAF